MSSEQDAVTAWTEESGIDPLTGEPPKARPEVKYPGVTVPLTGQDGNIFFIMGRVRGALKHAGASEGELEAFASEVMDSESYEAALRVVMRWVKVT